MYWLNYQNAIREIVEGSESLALDSEADREKLINKLIELNPRPKKLDYPHNSDCPCVECEQVYMTNMSNKYEQ